MQFESLPRQKYHGVDHKRLVDSVRGSSYLPYTSKEAYEILQNQWMTLIAVLHIFYIRIEYPKSGILYAIWESTLAEMVGCEP